MDEHEHHKKIDKYIRSVTNGDSHNNEEDEDRTGSDAPSEEVLDHPCVKGHKLRMFDDETKMFCRRCSFTKKTPDIAPALFFTDSGHPCCKGHKFRLYDNETKMFCARCSWTKRTPDASNDNNATHDFSTI
eukprot:3855_1